MVCRSTVTLISSGERYGFAVDTVSSDWRLHTGTGKLSPDGIIGALKQTCRYDAVIPRRPRDAAIDPVGVAPRAAPPPPNPLHPGVPR